MRHETNRNREQHKHVGQHGHLATIDCGPRERCRQVREGVLPLCDTEFMAVADPKSVKVNLTTGTGVDIEWKDGHQSHYAFSFLRDACPCALCDEERNKSGRQPGESPKLAPAALPMFKPAAKATSAEAVGKYAIKFHWN